jgi:hypothetical protein
VRVYVFARCLEYCKSYSRQLFHLEARFISIKYRKLPINERHRSLCMQIKTTSSRSVDAPDETEEATIKRTQVARKNSKTAKKQPQDIVHVWIKFDKRPADLWIPRCGKVTRIAVYLARSSAKCKVYRISTRVISLRLSNARMIITFSLQIVFVKLSDSA